MFPLYFLVSKKNGDVNLTGDLEKLGSSSPEINEAWFSTTLFTGSVKDSLARERMVHERGTVALFFNKHRDATAPGSRLDPSVGEFFLKEVYGHLATNEMGTKKCSLVTTT